tara:strand:+ start:306 stop:692 length:387 start_codon:yes stop_codon:yes gene_type:complete
MMHTRLSTNENVDEADASTSSAKLEYACPHCGEVKTIDSTNVDETHMVYSKDYDQAMVETEGDLINEYTKYDPTLPTIRIIPCPNELCISNATHIERDILYIRYNHKDLKYVYMCRHCNTTWKSASLG